MNIAAVVRNLTKFNRVSKFSSSSRCSTANACCTLVICYERTVDPQASSYMNTRIQWRTYSWNVDPVVKDVFNGILKGSRSFTEAEARRAINQFIDLSGKAKVPDYMAVKLASVVTTHLGFEEGKKILEMHYMSRSSELRFAGEASLMNEQVEGAIRRIFHNMGDDAYEAARQFYCRLIDLKFCKVKDSVLRIFIQDLLEKNQVKEAIEEFDYFSHYGEHGSLSSVAFFILRAAFKMNHDVFQKALEIINEGIESRLQQICILGSVFLIEEYHIQFTDLLRKQNYNISIDDVEFICGLARKCKEPSILTSFLSAHELFDLTDKSRIRIYESLVEIYGRASNLTGLLKIWEQVVAEKNLNDFRVVILKLGHFFKCNNFSTPTDMQYYLRQYRE